MLAFPTPAAEKESAPAVRVTAGDPECDVAAALDHDEDTAVSLNGPDGQAPSLQFEFARAFPPHTLELRFKPRRCGDGFF